MKTIFAIVLSAATTACAAVDVVLGKISDLTWTGMGVNKVASWKGSVPPPGMSFWYDFSDAPTITLNDGYVSHIADKSGNGWHSDLSGSTGLQPVYNYSGHNGCNSATFDGIANGLINSCTNTLVKTFAVVLRVKDDTGLFFFYSGSLYAGVYQDGNAALPHSGLYCANYMVNGNIISDTTRDSFYNSISSGWSVVVVSDLKWLTTLSSFSAFNYDGFQSNCEVGEIISYPRVLNSDDLLKLNAYLGKKWGVSVSQ